MLSFHVKFVQTANGKICPRFFNGGGHKKYVKIQSRNECASLHMNTNIFTSLVVMLCKGRLNAFVKIIDAYQPAVHAG